MIEEKTLREVPGFVESKRNVKQFYEIKSALGYLTGARYERYLDGAVHVIRFTSKVRGEEKPALIVYLGDSKKRYEGYYYASEERREEVIEEYLKRAKSRKVYKEERAARPIVSYEVGDIVSTSWGYEQTNLDFYQVVETRGKATVVVRPIASKTVEVTSWCSESRSPVKDAFIGEGEFTCRSGVYGINVAGHSASKTTESSVHHSSWGY